jgi:hypothetical protein
MKLDTERRRNAELRGEVGETDTVVLNFGADSDQPLHKGARIEFRWPGNRWDQHIQAYVDGDSLHIQGGRSLVIVPQVSNAFNIRLRDH